MHIINGLEYNRNSIDFIQTEEGRAVRDNTGRYKYEYNLTDHLGNVRYSFDIYENNVVKRLQSDDYYAFGMRKPGTPVAGNNRCLYNGKELQEELLGQYDYGARFYDPIVGRWNVPDILAELHFDITAYNYVLNNPISYIDPFGLDTVKPNQIVPPMPGVRPFDPEKDVVMLEAVSINKVKPLTMEADNTRYIAPSYVKNAERDEEFIGTLKNINKPFEIANEFNPKRFKLSGPASNVLDGLDVLNSKNKDEAIEKVTGIAFEKALERMLGSNTLTTGVLLVHNYQTKTLQGSAEMAKAWHQNAMRNLALYNLTKNEMNYNYYMRDMNMFNSASQTFLKNYNDANKK